MYTFEDYKGLAKGIRALATQYWVEVILRRLNAQNPNQLSSAYVSGNEQLRPEWLSNQSRFWYRKKQGSPVGQERIVDQAEKFLPGTKRWLLHPFWQFLNCEDAQSFQKQTDKMLLSLNLDFSRYLFKYDPLLGRVRKTATDRFVKKLGTANNLDALTCLLILSAERIASQNNSLTCELNALKMFLRMATVREMKHVSYDVYKILARKLSGLSIGNERRHLLNEGLLIPLQFIPVPAEVFENWLSCYSELMQNAITLGKVSSSDDDKLSYLYQVNHSSI